MQETSTARCTVTVFPAANTALPYVNQHEEQLQAVIDFLQNDVITLDLFANGSPIPKNGTEIARDESPLIEVVVPHKRCRSSIPCWKQLMRLTIWLEVKATDENGKNRVLER